MIDGGGDALTDVRKTHPLGGMKDNLLKPRVELIPTKPLIAMAEVLGYGAKNYSPNNWRAGMSWEDTYGSLQRHLLAWHDGEDLDPASGLSHLAHGLCQLTFLTEFELTETGEDDRFRRADATAAAAQPRSEVKLDVVSLVSDPLPGFEFRVQPLTRPNPSKDEERGTRGTRKVRESAEIQIHLDAANAELALQWSKNHETGFRGHYVEMMKPYICATCGRTPPQYGKIQ